MKATFPIFLQSFDQGFLVHVPDLPSCVTSGATLDEALSMATDALNGCLLVLEDEGVALPTPTPVDALPPLDGMLALVSVDTEAYRRQTDTRAVRRSVSLPAWMAALAEQRGISFSKILQDGLRQLL